MMNKETPKGEREIVKSKLKKRKKSHLRGLMNDARSMPLPCNLLRCALFAVFFFILRRVKEKYLSLFVFKWRKVRDFQEKEIAL
jgi:hypothetical protein